MVMASNKWCLTKSSKEFAMYIRTLNFHGADCKIKNKKFFYAVARGKEIGIYNTWTECKVQVHRFSNAKFKKFTSSHEAENFVNFWKNYPLPQTQVLVVLKNNGNENINKDECFRLPATISKKSKWPQEQSSSCVASPNSNDPEKRLEQPNATAAMDNAVVLHLDDLKRFDNSLKEMERLSSSLSYLGSDIKELTDTLKFTLNSELNSSSKKNQTTLCAKTAKSDTPRSKVTSKDPVRSEIVENKVEKPKKERENKKLSSNESPRSLQPSDDAAKNVSDSSVEGEISRASFNFDENGYVEVYTDGSASSNGQTNARASVGVWFGENHPLNLSKAVEGTPTNNVAEIEAARKAIELAVKAGVKKLKIFTDSFFLINCATKWIYKWHKNGWILTNGKPVKHKSELQNLYREMFKINVQWEKTAAHAGVKGNESAHRLAYSGIVGDENPSAVEKTKINKRKNVCSKKEKLLICKRAQKSV